MKVKMEKEKDSVFRGVVAAILITLFVLIVLPNLHAKTFGEGFVSPGQTFGLNQVEVLVSSNPTINPSSPAFSPTLIASTDTNRWSIRIINVSTWTGVQIYLSTTPFLAGWSTTSANQTVYDVSFTSNLYPAPRPNVWKLAEFSTSSVKLWSDFRETGGSNVSGSSWTVNPRWNEFNSGGVKGNEFRQGADLDPVYVGPWYAVAAGTFPTATQFPGKVKVITTPMQ